MKEWLTVAELSAEIGCNYKWPSKILNRGEIPAKYYKRGKGSQLLFHCSSIPFLKEKYDDRKVWIYEKDITPDEAVPYDGYLLTPSEIARLEEVRRQNGYRAMHYTTLSLTELIAMGGDKQNNYVNC